MSSSSEKISSHELIRGYCYSAIPNKKWFSNWFKPEVKKYLGVFDKKKDGNLYFYNNRNDYKNEYYLIEIQDDNTVLFEKESSCEVNLNKAKEYVGIIQERNKAQLAAEAHIEHFGSW